MTEGPKPTQPKGFTPPPNATPLHGAQSETFKWEDEGTVLQGIYVGLEDGSMGGKILILQTDKGKERASAPTQLVRALDGIKQGTKLAIEYTGTVKSAAGRSVKQFKVWAL
jgi:hypothetical protein